MFLLILSESRLGKEGKDTLNSIMFLLILTKTRKKERSLKHFKFHYVSINSLFPSYQLHIQAIFKFHYVSINSTTSEALMGLQLTLNSIMFLLIRYIELATKTTSNPLNSIMFLLILKLIVMKSAPGQSLNSIMFLLIPVVFAFTRPSASFKFHYVSINSNRERSLFCWMNHL